MEGLTLADLNLSDDSTDGVFDAFEASKKKAGAPTSQQDVQIEDPTIKKTTVSEEPKTPESVATGKDNQGQDGKTATDTSSNSSSPQKVDNSKLLTSFAAALKSKGVLPSLDLEKNKIESLEDINKAIQAELDGRLDSKQKAISEAMKLGLNVNKTAQQLETIEKLKEIPEEFIIKEDNAGFRLQVIAQDFKNKGYSDERANAMAQRALDAGADTEDAKLALQEIIKFEESAYNKSIKDAQDKEVKELDDIKALINQDSEILPSVKLSPDQQEQLYQQMTTDLGNKENAFIKAQKEDPIGSRVKLEALYMLTDGLKDFSMFGKKQVAAANNSFEDLLRGSSFAENGDAGGNADSNETQFGSLSDLQGMSFDI